MKRALAATILLVAIGLAPSSLAIEPSDELIYLPSINLSMAKTIAEAMEKKAIAEDVNVVIYILGADGQVLLLHRHERSGIAPLEWARNKAITAYQTKKQTQSLSEEIVVRRADTFSFVPGMAGGIPLVYKGERVGAIGISGASLPVDQVIAEEGLKVFNELIETLGSE